MNNIELVIFCGGRDFTDRGKIKVELLLLDPNDVIILHGDAAGADKLAGAVAKELGFVVKPVPADWTGPCRATCKPGHRRRRRDGTEFCPMAGPYRNQRMLDHGPRLVVAMPGGTGTADMLRRTRDAGIDWKAPGWRPFGCR